MNNHTTCESITTNCQFLDDVHSTYYQPINQQTHVTPPINTCTQWFESHLVLCKFYNNQKKKKSFVLLTLQAPPTWVVAFLVQSYCTCGCSWCLFSNNRQTGRSAKEIKKLHIMLSKPKKLISKVHTFPTFIYFIFILFFIILKKNCGVKFCQNVKIRREYFVTIFETQFFLK
jgi:hypothetical protein